jgi:Protein of unknown function (DUF2950)
MSKFQGAQLVGGSASDVNSRNGRVLGRGLDPINNVVGGRLATRFAIPQAAVDAQVAAVRAGEPASAVRPVLGPDGEKILSSGDKVEDNNARKRFISAYDQMHRLAYDTHE